VAIEPQTCYSSSSALSEKAHGFVDPYLNILPLKESVHALWRVSEGVGSRVVKVLLISDLEVNLPGTLAEPRSTRADDSEDQKIVLV
jgi:hypothetical protein